MGQLTNAGTAVECCWCASVEQSSGELQVGDRIIEVNGEPVQDQSLAEVHSFPHTLLLRLSISVCELRDRDALGLFAYLHLRDIFTFFFYACGSQNSVFA